MNAGLASFAPVYLPIFEIGRQSLANHEVWNWLEQSSFDKAHRLTAA
jgi:hypothetical protein